MQTHNTVFVFKNGVQQQLLVTQCLEKLRTREEAEEESRKTRILLVFVEGQSFEKVGPCVQLQVPLSVEDALAVIRKQRQGLEEELVQHGQGNESEEKSVAQKSTSLSEALHGIADSLHYVGDSVQVNMLLDSVDLDSRDSFLSLAGALQRLQAWHYCPVTVVKMDNELSLLADQLSGFLGCQVVGSVDDLEFCGTKEWSGAVSVMDCVADEGHIFQGFRLHCDNWNTLLQQKYWDSSSSSQPVSTLKDKKGNNAAHSKPQQKAQALRPVCGRCVEILQEVDLRTLPVVLLDKWTLTLRSCSVGEKVFEDYLQSLQTDQLGLLARLRLFRDKEDIPTCGELDWANTAAWKDTIMTNFHNMKKPRDHDLSKGSQFLHFLLLPSSTRDVNTWQAKVLLSPHELNSDFVKLVERRIKLCPAVEVSSIVSDKRQDENVAPGISQLPVIQADNFKILQEVFKGDLTQKELTEVMTVLQENCETLNDYLTRLGGEMDESNVEPALDEVSTDDSLNLCNVPEYLVLQSEEAKKRKFQSYPSIDSTPAASPIPVNAIKTKSHPVFNIQEILQLRKPDGSLDLSLPSGANRLGGHNLCRVDSQCDFKAAWPDSQFVNYHDVYYYRNEDDLRLEKRYAKIRDRGFFDDTRSSFVSPIKKNRRTLANLSPVRRSPRKRPAVLMSRSKSEIFERKPSPNEAMFKYPSARPVGKSPRKRKLDSDIPSTPILPLSRRLSLGVGGSSGGESSDISPLVRRSPRKHSLPPSSGGAGRSMTSVHERQRVSLSATLQNPRSSSLVRSERPNSSTNYSQDGKIVPRKRLQSSADFGVVSDTSSENISLRSSTSSTPQGSESRKDEAWLKRASLSAMVSRASLQRRSSGAGSAERSGRLNATPVQGEGHGKPAQMKRSDRHKMKLQAIIIKALEEKGISSSDPLHAACLKNLFNVSMVLLKALPNSQNLKEEMKNVVYTQVQQIINLEKRRSGIAL